MGKRILISIVFILVALSIASSVHLVYRPKPADISGFGWSGKEEGETVIIKPNWEPDVGGIFIPPFKRYSLVRGIGEVAALYGRAPHLPTWLPEGMRYADVYIGPVAIIGFSDRKTENFYYTNISIEVVPSARAPEPRIRIENIEEYKKLVEGPGAEGSTVKVVRVGDLWVDIAENAPNPGGPVDKCHFAIFWKDGLYYGVTVLPPLTPEDLVKIIEGIKPAKEVIG